ncbi:hypothetical protein ABIB42_001183 [Massilia sp. UYP32]|jgi:IS5 family transposase
MLRMYIDQQCLRLSDEGIEDAIYEIQSVRAFVSIDLTRRRCRSSAVCWKRMR